MKTTIFQFLLLGIGFFQIALPLAKADPPNTKVYVREFMTRDRQTTDITLSLTKEFEIALKNMSTYTVLDARDQDLIDAENGQDKIPSNSTNSPEQKTGDVRRNSDMVIFGELYDDTLSGSYSVTVTFEDKETKEKKMIKEVNIEHGKIDDKATRESAMDELVKKIVGQSQPVLKAEVHSFLVEITKCSAQGEDVTIDMLISNNGDLDRNLVLIAAGAGNPCNLFDDQGNQAIANYARVANREGRGNVQNLLVSGVPVKCSLEFGSVPAKATTITRLFINMSSGPQNFGVTFKSIPIER